MEPVLGQPIPCFKALITIHKVMIAGPAVILGECSLEKVFLENCARLSSTGGGYGNLIRSYVRFLTLKLDFHSLHQQFAGNFDYEEYLASRGVEDLDQGYQLISDLQDLLDRLQDLWRVVLQSLQGCPRPECRISSLVPVVEESYGIYRFITSMLAAMHSLVDSPDPLILLVERYASQFRSLKLFYADCNRIRYLVTLMNIPKLPDVRKFS